MSSSVTELQPGAIAYGRSGVPCEVVECRANCITLRRSDGTSIEVKPTAIVRWEFPEFPRAESEVKISSEPPESKNESREPLREGLFASDDMNEKYRPNIVRQDKVSSENSSIVRSSVRQGTLADREFQAFSDDSDGSDDTFKPLSAQPNFENFLPTAKAPVKALAIGDRVKLKGTQLTYNIIELYEHFMGWVDGERTYESWAKLQTDDGKPAHWKVQQLEAIQ
jgi:hypothetical protein